VDARDIKDLLRFVRDAGFLEFELEQEGLRLRVVKDQPPAPRGNGAQDFAAAVPAAGMPAAVAAPAALAPVAAIVPAVAPAAVVDPSLYEQVSPMVGTFYRAARPGAPPFASVGDRVAPGQILCIIEAMKLMNEIEAEVAGTITEVVPQNAQPVEYGEVLFRIRKD
jgi:acetyl-CoA carboxylase biotin carboxyl carrier protein